MPGCGSTTHDAAFELTPGDVALVRGGLDHRVADSPTARCLSPDDFRAQHSDDEHTSDPEATVFLCGAYQFAGDVGSQLVEALPPMLHLPHADDDPLHDAIGLLSRELATPAPGQQTVLDRLLDIVLVHALRASFRQSPQGPRWYQASTDPRLNPALRAIHTDAAHPWTVPELASLSGLSRAGLRPSIPAGPRPSADAVPHRVANDPRPRPSTLRRPQPRPDSRPHRLHLPLRLRRRVPTPPWSTARPMATRPQGPAYAARGHNEELDLEHAGNISTRNNSSASVLRLRQVWTRRASGVSPNAATTACSGS